MHDKPATRRLISQFLANARAHCRVGARVTLGLATMREHADAAGFQYGEAAEFAAENLVARELFADCGVVLELEEVQRLLLIENIFSQLLWSMSAGEERCSDRRSH